ncbi:predicted protein [Histoplasma mississippiense (nom. inval.)]|nr:predicted protein [Histoplasma mississippiense (nom. inval.)]EDN09664.1 predicted protein [Histoplasma mississippiense (nom. inval.)]
MIPTFLFYFCFTRKRGARIGRTVDFHWPHLNGKRRFDGRRWLTADLV